MSNVEMQMTKQCPNDEIRRRPVRASCFVLLSSFGFRHSSFTLLLALLILVPVLGCRSTIQQYTNSALPRALPPSPTLEQVLQTVNHNTAQIRSFAAPRASLSGPGFPTLRAFVAFERPLRLRLRAETALTGPEIDLGSNDELFWFWVRRNVPPTLFYCRHEQFARCASRLTLPIEPQWLVEALGIVEFDPRLPHQGPFPLAGDRVEIRTIRETPQGPQTKATVVDAIRGCVLAQQVRDAQGRVLATAQSGDHRRDPLTGLILPAAITVDSPAAQLSLRLDLGPVEINRPMSAGPTLWTLPQMEGTTTVDLCDPRGQ
jgi:hypothetical protein